MIICLTELPRNASCQSYGLPDTLYSAEPNCLKVQELTRDRRVTVERGVCH